MVCKIISIILFPPTLFGLCIDKVKEIVNPDIK